MATEPERTLFESILTAEILLLAESIARQKRKAGMRRIGGDYVHEAVSLIRERRKEVIRQILSDE